MKKNIFVLLGILSMLFLCVDMTYAVTVGSSATMPAGTVNIHISKVIAKFPFDGSLDQWPAAGTASETALAFGTLVELTGPTGAKLGVFGPSDNHYFAIDIAPTGGGIPSSFSVSTSFSPSGANTFGKKLVATFSHVTFHAAVPPSTTPTTTEVVAYGPQTIDTFQNLTSAVDFNGFWTRMYVGIFIPPTTGTGPTGAEAWTATTPATSYSGTLTISGAAGIV